MTEIIRIERLHKIFRIGKVEVPALRGVNLRVEDGEFVSLVGPSGCGKSTLLHVIGGLTAPTSGRVIVDGMDLGQMSDGLRTQLRKKKIGFVFQRFNLLPTLTAWGNIALACHIAGNRNGNSRAEMQAVIKMLGLEARMGHRPYELSGGEQQRVAIARAVVNRPKIILADEPTGNLDTENSELVLNMLCELNHKFGQTILLITHNPEVSTFTDRIVNMRDGHILES
ncbi:MAG: ABC transporter ATP-binding protein [Acidobacteria bacterium RIFCSPLOWO2_02_FULL_61_28]|nr:MAG: ABC transporter ATP-binding protein [Acidobacteria bacterium RIFCSPLOWO2_02_FULL_61_28]